jgi:hypothetical protein
VVTPAGPAPASTAVTPATTSSPPTTEAAITIPPTTVSTVSVTDCLGNEPQVRPSTMTLACGSDGVIITGVTWSTWGGSTATGKGQLGENSCGSTLEACATGKLIFEPASIVLGDLTPTALGSIYRSVRVTPSPPNPSQFTPQSERLPGPGGT